MTQDTHQRITERFADLAEHWRDNHDRWIDDFRFSNSANPEQFSYDQLELLKGRPTHVFDHTNKYINQVKNQARQNKPQIIAVPVDSGADPLIADVMSGFMRYVEYSSKAEVAYDRGIEHAVRGGAGYWVVGTRSLFNEQKQQEIYIRSINEPTSVYLDDQSTEPDGSDAMDAFIKTEVPIKDRKGVKKDLTSFDSQSPWVNRNNIIICEHYEIVEKTINMVVFVDPISYEQKTLPENDYWAYCQRIGAQDPMAKGYKGKQRKVIARKLDGNDVTEETTFPGEYIPVVQCTGTELWVEGKRYLSGLVRPLRPGQIAHNFGRNAMIESFAMQPKAPIMAPVQAINGHENAWQAMSTQNPAFLPYNHVDEQGNPIPMPTRLTTPQLPSAAIQLAQEGLNDMDAAVGMYRSGYGQESNATSGIAKRTDIAKGETSTYHYVDNQQLSICHTGRIIASMMPVVMDQERMQRIIGNDGKTRTVKFSPGAKTQINKKLQADQSGIIGVFDPTAAKFDFRITSGTAAVTQRQEAANRWAELLRSMPELAPAIAPAIADLDDIPNKEKVIKAIMSMSLPQVKAAYEEGEGDEQQQLPPEIMQQMEMMQQQIQQLHAGLVEADQEHQQREAEMERLKTQLEHERSKSMVDKYNAETERFKALLDHGLMPPELSIVHEQTTQALTHEILEEEQEAPLDTSQENENLNEPQPASAGFLLGEQE